MSAINRTRALLDASRKVIKINPQLVWLPFVYMPFFLITNIVTALPAIFNWHGLGDTLVNGFHGASATAELVFLAYIFIVYFLNSWVATYFGLATYLIADEALQGSLLTLKAAFKRALTYKKEISKWALMVGLISTLLRYLEEKFEYVGRWVSGIIGVAFGVCSIFAIPTIAQKRLGPIATLKKSGSIVLKSWGENVTYGLGMGMLYLAVIFYACMLPIALSAWLIMSKGLVGLGVTIVIISVLVTVWASFYLAAMELVFKAALYRYADTGDYIGPFTSDLMQNAFVPKPVIKKTFWKAATN